MLHMITKKDSWKRNSGNGYQYVTDTFYVKVPTYPSQSCVQNLKPGAIISDVTPFFIVFPFYLGSQLVHTP